VAGALRALLHARSLQLARRLRVFCAERLELAQRSLAEQLIAVQHPGFFSLTVAVFGLAMPRARERRSVHLIARLEALAVDASLTWTPTDPGSGTRADAQGATAQTAHEEQKQSETHHQSLHVTCSRAASARAPKRLSMACISDHS
jgi:hypothetical protein